MIDGPHEPEKLQFRFKLEFERADPDSAKHVQDFPIKPTSVLASLQTEVCAEVRASYSSRCIFTYLIPFHASTLQSRSTT